MLDFSDGCFREHFHKSVLSIPTSQDCYSRPISLDAVSVPQTVTYHILC